MSRTPIHTKQLNKLNIGKLLEAKIPIDWFSQKVTVCEIFVHCANRSVNRYRLNVLKSSFLSIRKTVFLIKIFQRKLEIRPLFIIWGWAFTTVTGSHWLRWTGHPYKLVWISLLESRILFLVYKHGLDGLIWMEIYERK